MIKANQRDSFTVQAKKMSSDAKPYYFYIKRNQSFNQGYDTRMDGCYIHTYVCFVKNSPNHTDGSVQGWDISVC